MEDTTQRERLDALVAALSSSGGQIMAQDHLPNWPAIFPDAFDAVSRQHADLGRWPAEHAPKDRTDQLAESWNRDREDRTAGREVRTDREDLATLAQSHRQRNAWVACHQYEITTWSQLDASIRRYEYRLGQAAAFARPVGVTSLLGPVPERVTATERWQVAAGALEVFRSRWDIAEGGILVSGPTNAEQRAHWDSMAATLASVGSMSRARASGPEAEQAWLDSPWERMPDLDRPSDEAKLENAAALLMDEES